MSYQPFEDVEFGGVDSRSNPLNMPQNRMLRCLNWAPKQGGWLELRYGYTTFTTSASMGGVIHSMIPYSMWNGSRYLLVAVGTNLYSVDMSTGTKSTPTVKDTAIASSNRWSYYAYSNRLYAGNGVDQKWFDGTAWRDNGLPLLTASQIAAIQVLPGTRELSSSERAAVTLTPNAGGSFPSSPTGIAVYCALFLNGRNDIGPCTLPIGSGRVVTALNDKIDITGLPNVGSNYTKLLAITKDGAAPAYFVALSAKTISAGSRAVSVTTVTCTGHGFSTNDIVSVSGAADSSFNGIFIITVIDANHFSYDQTYSLHSGPVAAMGAALAVKLYSISGTATTASIAGPTSETNYLANSDFGLAATTVGGPNPGSQFYLSIYNPASGQHVGNRVAIGDRLALSTYRSSVYIAGLPDISASNPEWELLIGRTGDGGEIPYICSDSSGNWQSAGSSKINAILGWNIQDSASELPINNDKIAAGCDKFAVVGDYVYAATSSSATIYRCGSEIDQQTGDYVGDPRQSWSPLNITTFPTGEVPTCLGETESTLFAASASNCAILIDLSGTPMWMGPWPVGCCGKRAYVKTPYGFFWLSMQMELCTMQNGSPVGVSDEYQAAELKKLDPSRASTFELTYFRDVTTDKDEIRIEGLLSDGTPYTVVHSFRLRDARSPVGQGFSSQFAGPLGTAFTVTRQCDSSNRFMVFAGASNGYLYKLYSGADDVGSQYDADALMLFNAGVGRPSIPFLDWWGDANVTVAYGATLADTTSTFEQLNTGQVQESPNDPRYRAKLTRPQIQKCYVRVQLSSHSADGNLDLNDPPHCPLETYGRVYDITAAGGLGSGL